MLLPTLLLWAQGARAGAQTAALQIALVGGVVGLGVGWFVVVYGLGVW